MARGTTLANLRLMLRAEIGQTMSVSSATQGDATLNMKLANTQGLLATMHAWDFLEDEWSVAFATGDRYKTLASLTSLSPASSAAGIDFGGRLTVEVRFNNCWLPVIQGIGAREYNVMDSDAGLAMDPIQRWRVATNTTDTTANLIEVWPIPQTAQTLRLTGTRELVALTTDASKADLDDMLIVLFTAADILARNEMPDANLVLKKANNLLASLVASDGARDEAIVLGANLRERATRRRVVPMVLVSAGTPP